MSRSSSNPARSRNLLLVEDNPGDVRLVREGFEDDRTDVTLHVASDGTEALDFLFRRGEHADAPRTDIVLLDWNVPGPGGEAILDEITRSSTVGTVPVVVLSGSNVDAVVSTAYDHHANACLEKPVDPAEFLETIRSFKAFWIDRVHLPHREDGD